MAMPSTVSTNTLLYEPHKIKDIFSGMKFKYQGGLNFMSYKQTQNIKNIILFWREKTVNEVYYATIDLN